MGADFTWSQDPRITVEYVGKQEVILRAEGMPGRVRAYADPDVTIIRADLRPGSKFDLCLAADATTISLTPGIGEPAPEIGLVADGSTGHTVFVDGASNPGVQLRLRLSATASHAFDYLRVAGVDLALDGDTTYFGEIVDAAVTGGRFRSVKTGGVTRLTDCELPYVSVRDGVLLEPTRGIDRCFLHDGAELRIGKNTWITNINGRGGSIEGVGPLQVSRCSNVRISTHADAPPLTTVVSRLIENCSITGPASVTLQAAVVAHDVALANEVDLHMDTGSAAQLSGEINQLYCREARLTGDTLLVKRVQDVPGAVIRNVRLPIDTTIHASLKQLENCAVFDVDTTSFPQVRWWWQPPDPSERKRADAADHLRQIIDEKSRSGSVRSRTARFEQELRSVTTDNRSEKLVLNAYRLLGFANSPARAAAAWLLLSLLALGIVGISTGPQLDWQGASNAYHYALELLVSPLTLFRVNDGVQRRLPINGPLLVIVRLIVAVPFAAFLASVARLGGLRR